MADYAGVLSELRERRAAIQQESAELDTAIGAIERLMSLSNVRASRVQDTKAPAVTAPTPESLAGMLMPQKLTTYFEALDRPELTTRKVIDGLKAAGVPDNGSLRGHVYNTLHRLSQNDGPFERLHDGRWSLRERPIKQGQVEIFSESAH